MKTIAAVRAKIIQSRISPKIRHPGNPCAATIIAPSAKGSAKTVCEKRMKVRNRTKGALGEELKGLNDKES